MPRIILVCSIHKENGLCNAQQLHDILELITPDVLFQEVPYFEFLQKIQEIQTSDFHLNNLFGYKTPLELAAISEYLKNHDLRQVPVDTFGMSKSEHAKFDQVIDRVLHAGPELKNILDMVIHSEITQGFGYLNSRKSDNINRKIDSIISTTLETLKDDRRSALYEGWKDYNTRRDEMMIQNIYNYSRSNAFNVGVFLFGAGHRQGLIRKIQSMKRNSSVRIDWKLYSEAYRAEVSQVKNQN